MDPIMMEFSQHSPVLIVMAPFLLGMAAAAAGWANRKWAFPMAFLGLLSGLIAAIHMLIKTAKGEILVYHMAGWLPPFGIAYRIDTFSALILTAIMAVALINLVASRASAEKDFTEKAPAWYALYVFFVSGLAGMVATEDIFNLYVLLEIASLSAYALIGMGHNRAPFAALNYLLMGTIGASFYLMGVAYIYIATGSLNMTDIAVILQEMGPNPTITMAFALCMTGLLAKMAAFPVHGWLPNAYTFAPDATTNVMAALTTKVSIYIMIRLVLSLFPLSLAFDTGIIADAMVWLATIGIFAGAFMALAQKSFKRMLTYIVVVEVAYMVGGFWLGNRAGMTGAMLHILNDAAMTLCVFMAVANIRARRGADAFSDLKGLFQTMPFSMGALVISGLAIIGIPPTCGFFSKWYLISGGIEAGHWGFVIALLSASIINAILFFKVFEIAFFEVPAETFGQNSREHESDHHTHHGLPSLAMAEARISMLIPLIIMALTLLALGFMTGGIVNLFIDPAIPGQVL
ncbi:multisubunit sodium/proton antiporter MrpD subunit [Desulfobotulus alkaliphilus]|uniref:Multisubunit sodium/proton antiporter MrpD subunit n=1 Tax=Desulfobotulus alkaliphilus TaxID=622671 RepID=A0A562S6A0_9BACT|nr:proton-conducting transporter membrane subunit [Desulfobotulus alkaliphilus]TWI76842.1 multisubunit sodium/proton antiporter MrpD subunit [Desulfobotulus alkaliphilus]